MEAVSCKAEETVLKCNTPFLLVSITQIADMENLDKKAIKYLGLFSPHPDPDP